MNERNDLPLPASQGPLIEQAERLLERVAMLHRPTAFEYELAGSIQDLIALLRDGIPHPQTGERTEIGRVPNGDDPRVTGKGHVNYAAAKTWLVVRKIEQEPVEVTAFDRYDQGAVFFDRAQQQWSDTYFCTVVAGPGQPITVPNEWFFDQQRKQVDQPASDWQPIATYDENGKDSVLVATLDGFGEAHWLGDDDGWWWMNNDPTDGWGERIYPTHWMPLPSPPKGEA